MMTPLELRQELCAHGYAGAILPCDGKSPTLAGWTERVANDPYSMAHWRGLNTGLTTRDNPALDIDITDPEVADACDEEVKDWLSERGVIPTRFGTAPKRAFIFRTATPFRKMVTLLEDPRGVRHRIEILGDGQQLVVAGKHPDTGVPYTYHGAPIWQTPREELVEVDEAEMQALRTHLEEMILERFPGWKLAETSNGQAGMHETAGAERAALEPVDTDELLAGAAPGDIDDRVQAAVSSRLRRGLSYEETVRSVVDDLREALGDAFDENKERRRAEDKALRFIKDNPELSDRLPDNMRIRFEGFLGEGRKAWFNRGGNGIWVVRGGVAAGGAGSSDGGGTAPGSDGPAAAKPGKVAIEALPFQRFDRSKLPAREWLYGGHYQKGIITATVGPGGSGKSSADLVELIAMCTGRNLLGEQPLLRCRAWYHNAEDGADEIYRRIAAVCQHYGIDQGELEGWLFVTSGLTMPIKIAAARTGRAVIEAATVAAIIRTISDNEIGVVSFDPLVATHGAVENATGEMDMFIREFARIANVTDCAVEIVHHTRKPPPGQEELSVMDSRGAVAIINAVRSARVLNTMAKTEADKVGVDEVDRRLYFRIDRGKANMAPPGAASWYKFESIDLPNGDGVGVATSWQHPGQGGAADMTEAAERTAEHVFTALLVRFMLEGRIASPSVGANYVPNLC